MSLVYMQYMCQNLRYGQKKIPPHAEGPSCKKFYTSNYFLTAVSTAVESAATAVVSTATAAVSVSYTHLTLPTKRIV